MPFFNGLMSYQTVAWDPYLQPSSLGQTLQSVMTHQFLSHFLGSTLHQQEGDHLWQTHTYTQTGQLK